MSGLAWNAEERQERELCRITSESAAVTVLAAPKGNGLRLKLRSERSGASTVLDATVLEALCHLTPEVATELVRVRTEGVDSATPYEDRA
ncbi:hypothetical protein [Micromonospora sp. WMMD712]|uniref:hypothetical protein n=1 Tax=Micromonospora sp. WMMD712 TaxID=3016096 RepID=UPI00249B0BFA|nr:hypothetical protein [Micromonospora sp. WMMD712]WFE60215.1 hypothetical protein O7633_26705 [Micromonospora sp. WMMD712]